MRWHGGLDSLHVGAEEERRAVGIVNAVRLPETVEQARELLREDDGLRDILGSDFVEAYTSLNEVSDALMTCLMLVWLI